MTTVQDAIRRLTIQAVSQGVDEATGKLRQLAAAQDNVAVVSEKTGQATLALDKKFASIERRYVETVRAQQDYERVQRQVNAAVSRSCLAGPCQRRARSCRRAPQDDHQRGQRQRCSHDADAGPRQGCGRCDYPWR